MQPTSASFGIYDLITALQDDVPDEVLKQILSAVDADPSVDANHLVQVIAPYSDRLTGDGDFKALRLRAIRYRKHHTDDAANEVSSQLEPTWPRWSYTVPFDLNTLAAPDALDRLVLRPLNNWAQKTPE